MTVLPLRDADPSRVVPPGRVGYDLRAAWLLLHTFIAPHAWDELVERGSLRARVEHATDDPVDPFAYAWMAQQVRDRLGADESTWPLWCWARTTRSDLVSSARRYLRLARGTVLITARVERERVLLSDFSAWHMPLNGAPVWAADLDDDALDRAIDDWHDLVDREVPDRNTRPRAGWPQPVLAAMTKSWPDIFDSSAWTRRTYVQACIAELRADDVLDAVRLVSR